MESIDQSGELFRLALKYIALKHSNSSQIFEKAFTSKEYNSMLVLDFLHRQHTSVYSHDLSNALACSTPQMAVLLRHMEEEHFIKRIHDETDARRTEIIMLPDGMAFYQDKIKKCQLFVERIFESMGKDKALEFVSLFNQFLIACSEVCRERAQHD